jgi:N-acetyl-anhydromuramyl-L-alanine amidase AmpD
MRELKEIIVHCSATPLEMDIGAKEIKGWHTSKGWSDIGYHYVIRRDGDIETGRPIEKIGSHVRGRNRKSIGICLIGGVDGSKRPDANFTLNQYQALHSLISLLRNKYGDLELHGHRDYSTKACPSFNVQALI